MLNTLSNTLEKAIVDKDESYILELMKDKNFSRVVAYNFDNMINNLSYDLIIKIFDIYKDSLSPTKRFNPGIKYAIYSMIRLERNDVFYYVVENIKGDNFNTHKFIFFATCALYGNIELMLYYLKDPMIDPSAERNSVAIRTENKIKISKNDNNAQEVLKILKADPRVIAVAAELNQVDLLPKDVQDIFVF